MIPLFLGMVVVTLYIGYFGAGAGFLIMSLLAVAGIENVNQINALKVVTTTLANGLAVVLFIFKGQVLWQHCLLMMVTGAIGGYGWRTHRSPPQPTPRPHLRHRHRLRHGRLFLLAQRRRVKHAGTKTAYAAGAHFVGSLRPAALQRQRGSELPSPAAFELSRSDEYTSQRDRQPRRRFWFL